LQEFSQALTEEILRCFLIAARNLAVWDYLDSKYIFTWLHCTVIIYTVHNIVGAYHQLKNYITLDWAVLFVLHELFLPILGHYFLLFMIFPLCLTENMPCRLRVILLFCWLTLGGALPLFLSVRMRRLHSNPAWVESERAAPAS